MRLHLLTCAYGLGSVFHVGQDGPPSEEQRGQDPDFWESWWSGCLKLGTRLSYDLRSLALGAGILQWEGSFREVQSSLAWREDMFCMTHMVHTQLEDKNWELQTGVVPAEGQCWEMPLNHRKVFF